MDNYWNFFHVSFVVFLFSTSLGLYITIYQDLIRYKRCVEVFSTPHTPIEHTEVFCHQIAQNSTHGCTSKGNESLVQSEASRYGVYNMFCYNVPAVLTAIIFGSWSEKRGRKLPLIFSLAGSVWSSFGGVAVGGLTVVPLYVFLISSVVSGLTGGFLVTFMATFAMVTDMSPNPRNRTFCISIGGAVVGSLITAQVFEHFDSSYTMVFLIAQAFSLGALLHAIIFVKETINYQPDEPESLQESLRACGQVDHIKASFSMIFKRRPGKQRLRLNLGLILFLFFYACDIGMPGLTILFLECTLKWTPALYSYYIAVQMGSSCLGMFLLLPLLKKVFDLRDTGIMVLGLLFSAGKMLLLSLSSASWMAFTAAGLSFFSGISYPSFRSFLSKQVEPTEIGRVFAGVATVENIAPALSGVVFNNIFSATVGHDSFFDFPGFAFVLSSLFQFLILLVLCWIHVDSFCRSRNPSVVEVLAEGEGEGEEGREWDPYVHDNTYIDNTTPTLQ